MNKETLIRIINGFARDRKVFSNEQDFQFELALALKKEKEVTNVKLEAVSFPKELGKLRDRVKRSSIRGVCKSQKEYTDLIVKAKGGLYYAIELKFKAANSPYLYNSKAFGDVAVMKHGAANDNIYRFMEDIVRLENINSRRFPSDIKITKGFAIILTNNNTYRNSSFENTALEEYSLMDKRSVGPGPLEIKDSYKHPSLKSLSLSGHYTFEWNDYKLESDAMLNDKTPKFSFLVVEVDPKKD